MKWGEYSSDVQFILQRSEQQKVDPKQSIQNNKSADTSTTSSATTSTAISIQPLERNKENRKSFGSHSGADGKLPENIGIVKGIPQILPTLHQYHQSPPATSPHHSPNNSIISNDNQNTNPNTTNNVTAPKPNEFNSADVRNSLDRKTNSFRDNSGNESLLYKAGPPISSNGALVRFFNFDVKTNSL